MNRLRQVVAFLGSKTLAVWLVGSFILYYLTMAVWSREAFSTYITHLANNNLFRFSYILFVTNIGLLLIRSLRKTRWMSARTILRLPLFVGFVFILVSFFMSVNIRDFRWLLIGTGDLVALPWEQEQYLVDHVEPALKKKILRGPDSAIFDFEPGVVLVDTRGKRHAIGAYPPTSLGASVMHVLNFGIGPGVELQRQGVSVYQGYAGLQLIPFGRRDSFKIKPYPYSFALSILPSRVVKRGKETANSYDLERPVYRITVIKGDREIAQGETATSLPFDEDMTLLFHPPKDWVLLEAAYDPFLPWLAFSIGLLFIGAILYPCSYFVGRRKPES